MAHPLRPLFEPTSVAVVGASERTGSVGAQVLANLKSGGYRGALYAVNPKHSQVQGLPCFPSVSAIGAHVDLIVVATPADSVLQIVRDAGEHGAKAAIVLSAGFAELGPTGEAKQRRLVEEARRFGLKLLGPNCLGLISTSAKLDATFAANPIRPGSLALVSQSGALCTAILDWAEELAIGFSAVVSIGDGAQLGFGEILDYLASNDATRAILVYVEGVRDARHFMSGLRVAARLKPTIVLQAGRQPQAASAARSHTGALVGSSDVFDAALRRAGAVRVDTIGQLFAAAQLLGAGQRVRGDQLAIVTNAGGPGVMAVDRAAQAGVELATLAPETLAELDRALPAHWSRQNPVDVLGDAGADRYRSALDACLRDPNVHGALVMSTPQAMTDPTACAEAVLAVAREHDKPVVTCWMGGRRVNEARAVFNRNGIPTFNTPEASIDAFGHLWAYHQNQRMLLQVTSPVSYRTQHDVAGARLLIERALKERRHQLGSTESKAVLSAFGIPCSLPVNARTPHEALLAAENLGFPVVLKIDSPDLTHKTDVDGVILNLRDGAEVQRAFTHLVEAVEQRRPDARIDGVSVERMYTGRHGRELLLGVVSDPCFGPAISIGAGGTLVELLNDRAVALPPINSFIARDMLRRTRVAPLLGPFRNKPAVDQKALEEVLGRVSDLVCELPEIAELDINPLIADEHGVLAVDVRIALRATTHGARPYAHMAIHPYPAQLQLQERLPDGAELTIRPIRPEDAPLEQDFVRSLSSQSKYFRFMQSLEELSPEMLVRLTQIDYDREMAFVALVQTDAEEREIGVSRYVEDPDGESCEFALVVADAWHGRGVGTRLMRALFAAARGRGLTSMYGEVLTENTEMLQLVRDLDFTIEPAPGDPSLRLVRKAL